MFERYTEKARRCIFFARYEASEVGSPYIEVDHLVLGIWREDKSFVDGLLPGGADERAAIAGELRALRTPGEKISTSVDLPLSSPPKRVLAYATEEAERLGHKHIGTAHLMLGVLREPSLANDVLQRHNVSLTKLRESIASAGVETASTFRGSASSLSDIRLEFRKLTDRLTHDTEPALVFRLP